MVMLMRWCWLACRTDGMRSPGSRTPCCTSASISAASFSYSFTLRSPPAVLSVLSVLSAEPTMQIIVRQRHMVERPGAVRPDAHKTAGVAERGHGGRTLLRGGLRDAVPAARAAGPADAPEGVIALRPAAGRVDHGAVPGPV
ncbi:hypothetical protein CO2235_MP80127 [Cupriavidus oxalaticus]|uniref:Uncharacterized protein n=1 Tax=Cupriavidus oxalaticus TaxID=96344 RepID=A0A375GR61_9BURK|nr:hypothetical protein CO2235_MP80127 [Cupriavidus oxalaticus]